MGVHRGDIFEEIINHSNKVYKNKGIAIVQKIATPMKPKRAGSKIIGAYYEEKSTLDYIGTCNGQAIAFDAKETSNKNNLPLKNIKEHQIDFMSEWEKHGGIAFLLVNFKAHGKVFKIEFQQIQPYWKLYKSNPGIKGMCSIPYEYFINNCKEVTSGRGAVLDYLI
ncbi:Holliday junction resolvase RecU [Clostridium cylindrosporum]|uniref:Holliday junction resolvase RecU n=1 Tax=Clostridium cylindrosporum DSM 605 TaxID=1121307 RepID=A0A0J8G1E5_CLOCY|nr:Holliday junction resolvase RecU [Clostridium cylindrosporum]KMT21576.1 holliday junction resolvase RecU [Clostridium cylindrosporum DSM 605]